MRRLARPARFLKRVVVAGLVGLLALTAMPDPVAAYTIEYPDADTIVIHSERLNVKTIRATIHVAIYRHGEAQWWVDAHNTGRNAKEFDMRCDVKFPTIYTSIRYATGNLTILSRRADGGRETFHGTGQALSEDRFDILLRDGFQVNCNLHNDSVF